MPDNVSEKSRGVALALCIPLGWAGVHRFYAGKVGTGLLQFLTGGGFGIWWFIDTVMIAAGTFRDLDGKRLWEWAEPDPSLAAPGKVQGQLEAIMDAMYAMREDMNDLSNRVDFMERVLEKSRDDRQVGPGPGG